MGGLGACPGDPPRSSKVQGAQVGRNADHQRPMNATWIMAVQSGPRSPRPGGVGLSVKGSPLGCISPLHPEVNSPFPSFPSWPPQVSTKGREPRGQWLAWGQRSSAVSGQLGVAGGEGKDRVPGWGQSHGPCPHVGRQASIGDCNLAGRPCRPPGGRSGDCNAASAGIGRGGGVVAHWPAPTTLGLRAPAICVPSY